MHNVLVVLLIGVLKTCLANDIALPTHPDVLPIDTTTATSVDSATADNLVPSQEISSIQQAGIWSRIRAGFSIPNLDNAAVSHQLERYLAHPNYLHRTALRASIYLFHVVQELQLRGMPSELALLPFIESAFNPQAVSNAKAVGMWQFMPATGRTFNLKQNLFQDERRDVLASTDAALNYLQKLYGMFGDWQLTLAAYNWGEGSVLRLIKRNESEGKPLTYASLSSQMPTETRNYVPKLQALKDIITDPQKYGITLPDVQNMPYFISVQKTQDIDITLAAKLAEMPLSEFRQLNPQFNRPVIIGDNRTRILLPRQNVKLFNTNFNNWKGPLSSWSTHTVRRAEHIAAIARNYEISTNALREANHIPHGALIRPGSTLLVPKYEDDEKNIPAKVADSAKLILANAHNKSIYVHTRKGDSLDKIAKRYSVSIAQLKAWNKISSNRIQQGKRLRIEKSQKFHTFKHLPKRKIHPRKYHKMIDAKA